MKIKPVSTIHHVLCLSLHAPVLSSCPNGQLAVMLDKVNHYLPHIAFGHGILTQQ